MIKDRRDRLVSAAQVAYYYPRYSLEEALDLPSDVKTLLLSVVVSEHSRNWDKLSTILGTTIDLYEMVTAMKNQGSSSPDLERYLHIPLLMGVAPEMFNSILDDYKKRYSAASVGEQSGSSNSTVQIGNLNAEEAKAMLLGISNALTSK